MKTADDPSLLVSGGRGLEAGPAAEHVPLFTSPAEAWLTEGPVSPGDGDQWAVTGGRSPLSPPTVKPPSPQPAAVENAKSAFS